ncbi:VOC family protein, partial [Crocinitomix catalasitica]|nr:VOC family protein [Crocinitomix catalasitica]
SKDSTYMDPGTKDYMINYRVADLVVLLEELKKDGVTICDEIEEFEYGKFVHIIDPEGNKIELWEPIDQPLIDFAKGETTN